MKACIGHIELIDHDLMTEKLFPLSVSSLWSKPSTLREANSVLFRSKSAGNPLRFNNLQPDTSRTFASIPHPTHYFWFPDFRSLHEVSVQAIIISLDSFLKLSFDSSFIQTVIPKFRCLSSGSQILRQSCITRFFLGTVQRPSRQN